MTKVTNGLHTGNDSFKCNYCKDNFHEACEDLMIFRQGVFKCNCICNTKVVIPQ